MPTATCVRFARASNRTWNDREASTGCVNFRQLNSTILLTAATSMVGASAPPSELSLDRTGVRRPHSEQYTSCMFSAPWRPFLSELNINSRVWTPRRSAVHTLTKKYTNSGQYRPHRSPQEGHPPINKFSVLATPFAWRWKANHFCPAHTCFLEITASEDVIESEVFVLRDVP